MARRNRKRNRKDGFAFPVPFAGLAVMLVSLALAYVWLGCRCDSLGRELKALEQEKMSLQKTLRNEEFRWVCLKSPQNMERALVQRGITMVWPESDRVVRLERDDFGAEPNTFEEADMLRFAQIGRGKSHE